MREKIVVPNAPILVESTRSIGYSFEAAVADIVDNSISAGATEVLIGFQSIEPAWLCIEDNGCGMTAEELENAMRYGSQSSLAQRSENDLGRFGLGMKMASLSQCRTLIVMTKKNGMISAASWDLDYIVQQNNWSLKTFSEDEIQQFPGYDYLMVCESGTVVIWKNFDRLQKEAANFHQDFDEKIDVTRQHLALVFHRFLDATERVGKPPLKIYMNGDQVKGIDPFLTKNPATQSLGEIPLTIDGEKILVKPYVLPIISKIKKSELKTLGGKEELRQRQGFYIYRNKRLIIWGTWFRLVKQNELGKLARVRVDIPNTLDSLWDIDVKKSKASLPYKIKKSLANIVYQTVGKSEKVYRYRGRKVQNDQLVHVWNVIDDRGTFSYRINKDFPAYKLLENALDEKSQPLLDSFLQILENSFPYGDVYYRMAKNETTSESQLMDEQTVYDMAVNMISTIEENHGDVQSFLAIMGQTDFFIKYPNVVKKVKEVYEK